MASDFDHIEKLLAMVPLFRLQCPSCKTHGEEDFMLVYELTMEAPLDWDGPAKIATVDYRNESLISVGRAPSVYCICGANFPLPEGWKIANLKSILNPSPTGKKPNEEPF